MTVQQDIKYPDIQVDITTYGISNREIITRCERALLVHYARLQIHGAQDALHAFREEVRAKDYYQMIEICCRWFDVI